MSEVNHPNINVVGLMMDINHSLNEHLRNAGKARLKVSDRLDLARRLALVAEIEIDALVITEVK